MTMTDIPEAPKPKRKYTRKAKATPVAEKSAEFAGMTATDCCDACNEKRCVISGINVCAHPHKGGLQAAQMIQSDVVKRYNRAKKMLGTPHA